MINRRQLLKSFAFGAVAAGLPGRTFKSTALKGTALNHISYQSADYKKTRDFYVDLLGFQASDEDEKQLYVWAGDALISAKNSPPATAPLMDHIGITLDTWDVPGTKAVLQERGLQANMTTGDPHDPGKSIFTRDPFRYTVQLCASDLEQKPAPVALHSPLKAVGLNHISYQCADYSKVRDFYSDLLGSRVSNDTGKQAQVWFGNAYIMIRNNTDGNPKSVIDHFGWTIADWNTDRVVAELKKRSLEAVPDAMGKSVMTKDLNGYPLQLCSKDL